MIPEIYVSFWMNADIFDLQDATKRIGVIPSRAREKTEWPPASIAAGVAVTEWSYTTQKRQCYSIALPFNEIIAPLSQKTAVIKDLIQESGLETGFVVVINAEIGDFPEMVLTKEIISFASSIKAEISFDMYID